MRLDGADVVAHAPEGRGTLFVNIHLCDRSEPIRRACTQGPQIEAVTQLLGLDVCLTHQQFITKLLDEPGICDSSIPLHQDNGYGTLECRLRGRRPLRSRCAQLVDGGRGCPQLSDFDAREDGGM